MGRVLRAATVGLAVGYALGWLLFQAWHAGAALDERFLGSRFRQEGTSDGCPIAVYRETAMPMCTPLRAGW